MLQAYQLGCDYHRGSRISLKNNSDPQSLSKLRNALHFQVNQEPYETHKLTKHSINTTELPMKPLLPKIAPKSEKIKLDLNKKLTVVIQQPA